MIKIVGGTHLTPPPREGGNERAPPMNALRLDKTLQPRMPQGMYILKINKTHLVVF